METEREDTLDTRVWASRKGLYAIVDLDALGDADPVAFTARVLDAGDLFAVQLRAKGRTAGRLVALARALQARCDAARVPFVMNDRADVACVVGAHLHVGQRDAGADDVASLRAHWPRMAVGVSTHAPSQWSEAARARVDYIAVGPVFSTRSKSNPDPLVGVEGAARAVRDAGDLPVVAIGGIDTEGARALRDVGVRAVAVIAALTRAQDVTRAARAIHSLWA